MRLIVAAILFLLASTGAEACIRPVSTLGLDPSVFACRKDSDCALIDDACRSCEDQVAVNSSYVTVFNDADEEARVDDMCLESCEACDVGHVAVKCLAGKCSASIDPKDALSNSTKNSKSTRIEEVEEEVAAPSPTEAPMKEPEPSVAPTATPKPAPKAKPTKKANSKTTKTKPAAKKPKK